MFVFIFISTEDVACITISRIFLPLSSPGGDINLANDTKMDDKNGIKMIRKNYINNILQMYWTINDREISIAHNVILIIYELFCH